MFCGVNRARLELKLRQLIVELDLHRHRAERLDEVRLIGPHEAGMVRLKESPLMPGRVLDIAQSAVEHSDHAPPQCVFVENRAVHLYGTVRASAARS